MTISRRKLGLALGSSLPSSDCAVVMQKKLIFARKVFSLAYFESESFGLGNDLLALKTFRFPDFSQFYIFPFCHESLWSFLDRDEIYLFHVSHVIGYWFVRFDTRERNVSLLRLPLFIFQFCAQCPGHWIEVRLEVTFFLLFMCKSCYSHANKPANRIMYMLPPASLLFKGQDTEYTTVELSFVASNHNYDYFYCQIQEATISTGLVKSVGCNLWLALTYCLDIYPCTL